jgi:hypothetical protein
MNRTDWENLVAGDYVTSRYNRDFGACTLTKGKEYVVLRVDRKPQSNSVSWITIKGDDGVEDGFLTSCFSHYREIAKSNSKPDYSAITKAIASGQ